MRSTGRPVNRLDVVELGLRSYAEVWELQSRLVDLRAADEVPDTLLLVEHPAVITLGRKATEAEHVLVAGTPIFAVERGGEATYHAPGQLVGYPILRLEGEDRDLHLLLRRLEEVLIRAIAPLGLAGYRVPGKTGVWLGGLKVASLGLAVRRWVSYHGFALNVDLDLAGFGAIRACGMDAAIMTSLAAATGGPVDAGALRLAVVEQLGMIFRREPCWVDFPAPAG